MWSNKNIIILYLINISPKKTYRWLIGVKGCSSLLMTRKMQIITIVRYHLTLVRITIAKKSTTINAGEGVEKRGTLLHCGWEISWYNHYGEEYEGSSRN